MYKNNWIQKYNIGDRVFSEGHDEALYVVSIKACSGHENTWLEYTVGDSMPQPWHYPDKTFVVNESLVLTEQEFKDKKIKLAKEMLEKYSN